MANLPPREPPDLRNRGGQPQPPQPDPYDPYGQQVPGQPPAAYPPQGFPPAPPPQLGQRPGTGPLPPYPPQPPQGQGYPPPQQPGYPQPYPPQQPGYPPPQQPGYPQPYPPQQPGYPQPYPPQGFPPAQTPQLGGQQPYPPADPGYYDPGLAPASAPQLKRKGRSLENEVPGLPAITERRVEYLAWGTVVLMMGCTVIFAAVDFSAALPYLRTGMPLLVGGILLISALVQRIIFSGSVSRFTWAFSIFSLAFGCTQLIAIATGSDNLFNQGIYFIGLMIVISGGVILLQILRPAHAD